MVQKLRQIITKTTTNKKQKTTTTKTTRKSPSQICVSPQSKTAKQQGTGQGPTKPKNAFRFALDTVTLATVSSSKTCKLIIHCGSAWSILHDRQECLTWEQIRESSVAGRLMWSTTEAACMDVLSISTPASLLFILHRSAYSSKSVPVNIHRRKGLWSIAPPRWGGEYWRPVRHASWCRPSQEPSYSKGPKTQMGSG